MRKDPLVNITFFINTLEEGLEYIKRFNEEKCQSYYSCFWTRDIKLIIHFPVYTCRYIANKILIKIKTK